MRAEVPLSGASASAVALALYSAMPGTAFPVVNGDAMDELPAESRNEVVAEIRSVLGIDAATAEDLVGRLKRLWHAMERARGLVDS
jgi:hypothetical protein